MVCRGILRLINLAVKNTCPSSDELGFFVRVRK